MKQLLFLCMAAFAFTSCNSQKSKAMQEQQKAYNVLKSLPGGAISTADGSWTMTAAIDGKPWKANYMMSPDAAGRILGHYNDEYIGLPFVKSDMVEGKRETFKEHDATDLRIANDDNPYAGREGEMVITKVNGDWAEGTFHFKANTAGSSKVINVTDGFFRINITQ